MKAYNQVVCIKPGEYGSWAPDLTGIGSDTFTSYRDGIWSAPSFLGKFTNFSSFEFQCGWNLTIPTGENETKTYTLLDYEVSNEVLPPNAVVTKGSSFVNVKCQSPENVDLWHSVGSYISPRFVLSSDMYYSISVHTPISREEFAKQPMHYTGKSWTSKGINAYTIDGYIPYAGFRVQVRYYLPTEKDKILTSTRDFKIQVEPLMTWQEFKRQYALYCESEESEFRLQQNV